MASETGEAVKPQETIEEFLARVESTIRSAPEGRGGEAVQFMMFKEKSLENRCLMGFLVLFLFRDPNWETVLKAHLIEACLHATGRAIF